ncbi:MAG: S8 family peptidase, partial [Myxococcota bacterium]
RLLAERIALEMRTWEFTFADALASPGPLGLSALAVLDVIDSFEEFERRCNEERPTRALASPHIMEGTLVEELTWGQRLLGVPAVWALTQGEGVTVAVLDTGCDVAHPDLSGALIDSRDFTGQGGRDDNPVWDAHGHGTHCAGIVGARRNDMGFVGVAPACSLLIAKVLGDDGTGDPDAVAAGIRWAVAQGADVLSISLGGPRKTPALYRAVHAALLEGVMVICAAGNAGSTVSNAIGYPGRYGSVVCVGAHDEHGQPSGFSSRGGELDVLAPGERVWSTYPGGRWAKLSGTSMAAPFVAGLAALIVAKHKRAGSNATPLRNTEDLKRHLTWMATHPGHHNPTSGYGALQPFLGVSAPSAW